MSIALVLEPEAHRQLREIVNRETVEIMASRDCYDFGLHAFDHTRPGFLRLRVMAQRRGVPDDRFASNHTEFERSYHSLVDAARALDAEVDVVETHSFLRQSNRCVTKVRREVEFAALHIAYILRAVDMLSANAPVAPEFGSESRRGEEDW